MLDTDSTDQPQTTDTDTDAPRRPAPRKRAPRKATAAAGPPPVDAVTPDAPVDATSAGDTPAAPAPRKRAPRKTAAKAAPAPEPTAETSPTEAATADPTDADPTDTDPTDAGAAAPARKTARRTRSRATTDTAAVGEAAAAPDDAAALPAAGSEADGSVGTVPAAALEFTAPAAAPAKRATRKRAAKKTAATADPAEQAVADEAAVAADTDLATDPDGSDAPVAPGVLFVAPAADAPAPRRRRAAKKTAAPADPAEETPATLEAAAAVEPDTETDTDEVADPDDVREAAIEQANGARRRRRRGRRGRGGVARSEDTDETGEDDTDDVDADSETDDADPDAGDESGEQSATSRRRRRRRRSGTGGDGSGEGTDDPPNTVVHVRDKKARSDANAAGDDGVRGIKGSTRLEAKRQRRRDGRDTTRRRAPILTEAEFLARREAVDRVMAVRQNGDRTQIAVLEDDILVEHYVTRASSTSYVGNVYLGRVQNVLPSMEAAFVDIGKGRNGVLYAGEVNWDAAGLDGKSRTIEHAMKSGDPVLVQVTKDPIGHKGARLTSQVSLPGRFVVYVPGGGMTGISRRLPDAERHRLKSILKKIVPDEAGVIVRTAAEGASEEDLTHDVERLQAQWEQIQSKAEQKKSAPVLLHGEPDLAIRVVRDVFNEDFKSLVVQGAEAWDTVSDYLGGVAPDLAERASKHVGNRDLFHELRVDEQLMKALDRKVWLPSGGSLVIDRTEAMTVIDVNTGKFVGSGGNLEQTVTRNNLEAAEEIVRQLRLRDVGGIVVIDFIDMVLESNRELVLRRLTECLGRDRTKHQVAEVTSLGLVQMTRKRVGEGLLEAFSEPCEHCHGRGVLVHQEPVEQKSGSSSDDDERSSGRGKRRRGGKSGATNEPVEAVEPPMTDEQRQAANAAIAAIHKAAALEKAEAGETTDHGIVATLATDLVAAARQADPPAEPQPVAAPEAAAAPEVPSEPEPEAALDAPLADQGPDVPAVELEAAAVAEGPTSTDDGTDDDGTGGTDPDGTDAGAGSAAPAPRRRRRAASRPAGPPVLTP